MDGSWQKVGKKQRPRQGQSAVERAVRAALFTFGRSDAAKGSGRGPQWICRACTWSNDVKRP
eukprot:4936235-Karenia_brevis.AAC.1